MELENIIMKLINSEYLLFKGINKFSSVYILK